MRSIKFLFVITSLLFVACKKDKKEEDPTPVESFSNGLLVLNEGLFQQNNSSLSWVNFSTNEVNNSIFEQKANRLLGDTGNDIQRYGNKIYVVVNVSSTIEVLNATTGNSEAQIAMSASGTPKQPRSIAFYNGKAYVSCFDGYVDVIDTVSLTVQQRIQVGANPEDIVVANNHLYVTNSGGLNYPNVDSTVSVIDPISNTELLKITVGNNPGGLEVDYLGNVYAIARGNYGTIPSRMVKINPLTNTVETTYPFNVSSARKMNNKLLLHCINLSVSSIQLFDPTLGIVENPNFIDVSGITTLYNIQFDSNRNQIYCFDAMNYTNSGYIRCYSSSGSYLKSIHVGLNPSKALIYD